MIGQGALIPYYLTSLKWVCWHALTHSRFYNNVVAKSPPSSTASTR